MKRHTSATLALTATLALLLFDTAIAQEIIKEKPTPSRAEWAPLGYAYGQDYSTSDVTKVVVIGSGTPAADPHTAVSPSQSLSTVSLTLSTVAQAFGETRRRTLRRTVEKSLPSNRRS